MFWRHQAIAWTNPSLLSMGRLETTPGKILIKIQTFFIQENVSKNVICKNVLHFTLGLAIWTLHHLQVMVPYIHGTRPWSYLWSADVLAPTQCRITTLPSWHDFSTIFHCLWHQVCQDIICTAWLIYLQKFTDRLKKLQVISKYCKKNKAFREWQHPSASRSVNE